MTCVVANEKARGGAERCEPRVEVSAHSRSFSKARTLERFVSTTAALCFCACMLDFILILFFLLKSCLKKKTNDKDTACSMQCVRFRQYFLMFPIFYVFIILFYIYT